MKMRLYTIFILCCGQNRHGSNNRAAMAVIKEIERSMMNEGASSRDVQKLVALPFGKSVEIAFKSIKVRFFRNIITVISLVLAVSFLSFTQVSNNMVNDILAGKDPRLIRKVITSGYDIQPGDTRVENTAKQRWIVILSLLVCVVGIINAQLMAVTERFREIGTMKCLGALDRFIVRLFLLEALMQGLAGSIIGSCAGALFAFLNAVFFYGMPVLFLVNMTALIQSMAVAMAVGCVLSLIGVIYPVIMAAGMQPVDAMRIEN